jgi:hypothetical protein
MNDLSAGPFDPERMDKIVTAVRRYKIDEKGGMFHIDDFSRPEAIFPLRPPFKATPNVWARFLDGGLQVAIIARDRGHLGEYGFVFRKCRWSQWNISGNMEDLGRKIADRWWEAANKAR